MPSTLDASLRIVAAGLSEDDQRLLAAVLRHWDGELHSVSNRAGVIRFLSAYSIPIVVADRDLPEGGWKALLNQLARMNTPPRLIVTSSHADDRLWADVLNQGGFDVLSRPFHTVELSQVIDLAWRQWQEERAQLERKIQLLALVAAG